MKNFLLFAFVFIFIVSCKKEELNKNGFMEGMTLSPGAILENVPSEYLQDSVFIIYKNAAGEERRIKHTTESSTQENGMVNGQSYSIQNSSGQFTDPERPWFDAWWLANAQYEEDYTLTQFFRYSYMADYGGQVLTEFVIYTNNSPTEPAQFGDMIELNGSTFTDYIQMKNDLRNGYSEMIFNKTYGMIAFRDQADDLWVFDRFE